VQLAPAALIEHALARGEGHLSDRGALVVRTGLHTGRSPRDRYLVDEPALHDSIDWGTINQPMPLEVFDRLHRRVIDWLNDKDLFVCDAHACADPRFRLPIRLVADKAWYALFASCLFREAIPGRLCSDWHPDSGLSILCAPELEADPVRDGTRSNVFVALDLRRRIVLVGGTQYAGEIKKSVFSLLNQRLPDQGIFPMHCSANLGPDRRTALFFGLSGTGKTTLSADGERHLIGDDEHGWSDEGVFNIEGGCYAKCINLSAEGEPQIYRALLFGSVLENVVIDPVTHQPDFADGSLTENTRAAYPLTAVEGAEPTGQGGHPATILFLTCDAFGVLPPISRLTPEQAMYHFLSGYTARVAGTEKGVVHPEATFSTCFAAPFLPLRPTRYAEMLRDRLRRHASAVWLVNTGWVGGPPGVGRRMPLEHTRSMVRAILAGQLDAVPVHPDPIFGVHVPHGCPGVPAGLLQPRSSWGSAEAYDEQARQLAALFARNFEHYASGVEPAVREAGPRG
jgi:phosphoenolpyruvate carboxykinase (ATP)